MGVEQGAPCFEDLGLILAGAKALPRVEKRRGRYWRGLTGAGSFISAAYLLEVPYSYEEFTVKIMPNKLWRVKVHR